ncbi:MAG: UDP-N-acetylmuramate dehydrogenase [Candidatus Levyibacteriota bacterium]
MDKKLNELEMTFGPNRIRKNEPMSLHTTFKIGGPAKFYLNVEKIDDLVRAVKIAKKMNLPFFILGGGSNILVSDKGFKGLVIKNNCRNFEIMMVSGNVKNKKVGINKALVSAESGAIMNQLVRFTIEHGLSGLEYQLGLPGTVGGAVFMNSNFPKENSFVGDCVYQARLLTKEGEVKDVDNSYFHFGYDESILQKTGEMILSVVFKLSPEAKNVLWERGTNALEYRKKTQPAKASAGCAFRNISMLEAINIPTPDRITSVGYLIEKAGLKGKRIGDAVISDMHANYILNAGHAKAEDVLKLINLIKGEIFKMFNVKINLEIKTIGIDTLN